MPTSMGARPTTTMRISAFMTLGLMATATGPALGQTCLTADDALSGIEVLFSDGARSVVIRAPDGSVTEVEDIGEGKLYTYIAGNGFLESGYIEGTDKRPDRFTYTFDVMRHAPPGPEQGQSGEQITIGPDGNQISRVPFAWQSGRVESQEYDRCDYDVIPIQTRYGYPEGETVVDFVWLIDLQIPLNVGISYPSGTTTRLPLLLKGMRN